MGGTWLLTFLQHQNALFYNQNPKLRRRKLLRSFRGLCVNSATFAFADLPQKNLGGTLISAKSETK